MLLKAVENCVFLIGEEDAFRRQAHCSPARAQYSVLTVHVALAGSGKMELFRRGVQMAQSVFRGTKQGFAWMRLPSAG